MATTEERIASLELRLNWMRKDLAYHVERVLDCEHETPGCNGYHNECAQAFRRRIPQLEAELAGLTVPPVRQANPKEDPFAYGFGSLEEYIGEEAS